MAKLTAFPASLCLWKIGETGFTSHDGGCVPQPGLYLSFELSASLWARGFLVRLRL